MVGGTRRVPPGRRCVLFSPSTASMFIFKESFSQVFRLGFCTPPIIQPLGSFVRLDGRWIRINMDDRTPAKGRRQPGLAAPQELSSYLRASVSICGSVLVFRPTAR